MSIHLYAEHLVNIRTLSIQASLSTITNQETRAELAADGTILSLSHEGETASVELPIRVPSGQSNRTLILPQIPSNEISFRFQLEVEEKPGNNSLRGGNDHEPDDIVPWTASSLTADTEICCKSCAAVIVSRGRVKLWKDLPSENWAEMMDFWHCHRPDVPHDHDHKTPVKGYSADSRLVIQSGVGMVDPVDFVLALEDCQNLTSLPSPMPASDVNSDTSTSLACTKCNASVGQIYSTDESYKIRKLALSLSLSSSLPNQSFEPEKWLACHLLSSIETQGVRKFLIRSSSSSEEPSVPSIGTWIFNPDVKISSSASPHPKPFRAMKILWKDAVEQPQQDGENANGNEGKLNRKTLSEGEIELPEEEFKALRKALIKSSDLLPRGSKMFQEEWRVALLPRFVREDLQLGVDLPLR